MRFGLYNYFYMLITFVTIGIQWVGVMGMRRARRKGWIVMVIGTILTTLAYLVWLLLMVAPGLPNQTYQTMNFMLIHSCVALSGVLLFSIGFAIHGLSLRAATERQVQLEALTTAMAEELRALRSRE